MQGWIKLHRGLKDSDVFNDSETLHVWIYILLQATHDYIKVMVKKRLEVHLYPGQLIFGRKEWARRLKINEYKVYRVVKWFEEQEMITILSTKHYSVITIRNWSAYQKENDAQQYAQNSEQQNAQPSIGDSNNSKEVVAQENTHEMHNKCTHNKNVKNVKNVIKNIYAENVKMTEEQYSKLIEKYGEEDTKAMIEMLDVYKGSSGKKYPSDYHAILKWVADAVMKEKIKPQKTTPQNKNRFHNFQQRPFEYTPEELEEILRARAKEG